MINRAVITGRLTRDPDLRYTKSGKAVAQFTVAVNRSFKNANGEREADFIQCVIWGKSAESFTQYFHKGSLVGIDGRIQTRTYEDNQNQRRYVTEIVTESFTFLESKNNDNGFSNNNDYSNNNNQSNNSSDPFANNASSVDIKDDDLPF